MFFFPIQFFYFLGLLLYIRAYQGSQLRVIFDRFHCFRSVNADQAFHTEV